IRHSRSLEQADAASRNHQSEHERDNRFRLHLGTAAVDGEVDARLRFRLRCLIRHPSDIFTTKSSYMPSMETAGGLPPLPVPAATIVRYARTRAPPGAGSITMFVVTCRSTLPPGPLRIASAICSRPTSLVLPET